MEINIRKNRLAVLAKPIATTLCALAFLSQTNAKFSSADTVPTTQSVGGVFDVKTFGATGNGKTLDTAAINKAIEAASAAGGGTVAFPAGTYLSASIHLKSNITLNIGRGAVIEAAAVSVAPCDPPEPNAWEAYQDFGHSHFHNSLIWGEDLHDVSIEGPGLIYGKGLTNELGGGRGGTTRPTSAPANGATDAAGTADAGANPAGPNENPAATPDAGGAPAPDAAPGDAGAGTAGGTTAGAPGAGAPGGGRGGRPRGPMAGNKAIALKNCHNVVLKDFSVLHGGHFAILVTGVDNLDIDNLKLDTNRDGMDVDACHNVRITKCSVNSPWDDGICPKSSYALGYLRDTENMTISDCFVTGGLIEGTLIDGTFKTAPDRYANRNGRIKLGTESSGGFKNITITNCIFDNSGGLAIESVDGGVIEDVTVSNLAMRNIANCPIFIRLGNRLRTPNKPKIGIIRRVNISGVEVNGASTNLASIIAGVPGFPVQDVRISNMHILQNGGGTTQQAIIQPETAEDAYPEPSMFGAIPAYGFFVRHAANVEFSNIEVRTSKPDKRPAFVLTYVKGVTFQQMKWQPGGELSSFHLQNVIDFNVRQCLSFPDTHLDNTDDKQY